MANLKVNNNRRKHALYVNRCSSTMSSFLLLCSTADRCRMANSSSSIIHVVVDRRPLATNHFRISRMLRQQPRKRLRMWQRRRWRLARSAVAVVPRLRDLWLLETMMTRMAKMTYSKHTVAYHLRQGKTLHDIHVRLTYTIKFL